MLRMQMDAAEVGASFLCRGIEGEVFFVWKGDAKDLYCSISNSPNPEESRIRETSH